MKLFATLVRRLLLSAAFVLAKWLSGYFISPLASVGISMICVLSSIVVAAGAISHLIAGQRVLRQRVSIFLGTLAIASLPFLASFDLEGFEYRIRQVSESEWLEIAGNARSLILASSDDGKLPRHPVRNWNREYVEQLANSYPILKLGDVTPKLFVGEDNVGVYWGSGVVGTLAVDISSTSIDQPYVSDGFFQRKKIYDHVALVWAGG